MESDTIWMLAVAGVGAVGAVIAAGATVILARLAWREIPSIKQELTANKFVVEELGELIQKGAKGPHEQFVRKHDALEPVRLSDIRYARHEPVYDRIVFDFVGELPSITIVPLTGDQLAELDVQGVWGISVLMSPCRAQYKDGPSQGFLAPRCIAGSPGYPTIRNYRLVTKEEAVCEWAIGCGYETRYVPTELDSPPRLAIDFYRRPLT